jgi:hypothetical protein
MMDKKEQKRRRMGREYTRNEGMKGWRNGE